MGGSAPKQKISQQERDQAEAAVGKWNERIDGGYLALEREGVADSKKDHTGFIAGKTSADIAQSEQEGLRQVVAAGGKAKDFNSLGTTVARASSEGAVDSAKTGQTLRDTRMIGSMKVGQDVSLNSQSGLRSAAILGSNRAQSTLDNKVLKDNAKFGAVMEAAGGAVTGATLRADGFRVTSSGLQKTNQPGLRGAPLEGEALTDSLKKKSNTLGWTAIMGGG